MAGERTVHGGLLDAMRAELEPQLAEIRGRLAALEARPLPSADPLRAIPKYGPPPFGDPERLRQLVEELSEPQPAAESEERSGTSETDNAKHEQDERRISRRLVGVPLRASAGRDSGSDMDRRLEDGRRDGGGGVASGPGDDQAGTADRRVSPSPDSTSAAGGGEHSDDCPGDARRIELGRDHCCLLQSAAKRTPPEPAERCGACVGSGTIYSASLTPFDCRACNGTGRKPQPAAEGSGEQAGPGGALSALGIVQQDRDVWKQRALLAESKISGESNYELRQELNRALAEVEVIRAERDRLAREIELVRSTMRSHLDDDLTEETAKQDGALAHWVHGALEDRAACYDVIERIKKERDAARQELEAERKRREAAEAAIGQLQDDVVSANKATDITSLQRDAALERVRELDRALSDDWATIKRLENELAEERTSANDLFRRAEKLAAVVEAAVKRLGQTRWYPEGSIVEWAKSREGQNHAVVQGAMDKLRAALADADVESGVVG